MYGSIIAENLGEVYFFQIDDVEAYNHLKINRKLEEIGFNRKFNVLTEFNGMLNLTNGSHRSNFQ